MKGPWKVLKAKGGKCLIASPRRWQAKPSSPPCSSKNIGQQCAPSGRLHSVFQTNVLESLSLSAIRNSADSRFRPMNNPTLLDMQPEIPAQ